MEAVDAHDSHIHISVKSDPHHPIPDTWKDGDYWACESPEKIAVTGIWWDEDCPKCCLAYQASIANDDPINVIANGKSIPIRNAPIEKWRELGLIE